MEMNVQQAIAADREVVWKALNDPEVLKAAIPGCESLELDGDNRFNARIIAKVGPVKAKFNFKVELNDLDPPNSYTINGEGQGGAAGFAKGSARVTLQEQDGGTLLSYQVKANVGGKLAQLGSRLIDGTASKLAGEFFDAFIAIVTNAEGATSGESAAEAEVPASSVNPWPWIIAAVCVLALAAFFLI